ncbi:MAG: phosphatase PAP2 family protein [Dehalococcoidales bacterium]|jgi:membrane-associated phospholipid phosphatase
MKVTGRRVLWLAVMLALLLAYIPINHFISGGHALSLPVDAHIPLFPPAIIPYLFGTLLFIIFPVWAAFCIEKGKFEAYVVSFLAAAVISNIIYLTWPTYVVRPEVTGHDVFSRAITLLYGNDRPYNAAPSGHTFYTLISFLYLWYWKPTIRIIGVVIALLIIASTLFTKQHYVFDVISGLALGVFAFWLGRFLLKKYRMEFAS